MALTIRETSQVLKFKDKTPCYLFENEKFDDISHKLRSAFQDLGLNLIVGYSVKTNNARCILKRAYENFGYLEVCSAEELKLAKKVGAKESRIIYNGVLPEIDYRFRVASHGGIVNIDNYTMYCGLVRIAEKHRRRIKIGIRVNGDIGNGYSRFGVIPDSEEWNKIFQQKSECVDIVGISFHRYGGRGIEGWEKKLDVVCSVVDKIDNLEYIDFGSNFYGAMQPQLAEQFGENIPSFSAYARLIETRLHEKLKSMPAIIVEPGTPLVGNSVSILSKVADIKKQNGKKIAIADVCRFDIGFLIESKEIPYDVVNDSDGEIVDSVHGYACTENDVLIKNFSKKLSAGDFILFRNCGAYSYSQASDFICKKPKMYEVEM